MVSKGRKAERAAERSERRERSLERASPFRKPQRRIYIVCEGIVTEREYFEHLGREFRQSVHVDVAREHGTPKTVVDIAVAERARAEKEAQKCGLPFPDRDEFWAVFDRDAHPNFDAAIQTAKTAGVSIAFSNPCFELWALLHFQDHRAHIERHKASDALRKHMKDYDKSLDVDLLEAGYAAAVRRAKALSREATKDGDPHKNPTTTVHMLTESIRTKTSG